MSAVYSDAEEPDLRERINKLVQEEKAIRGTRGTGSRHGLGLW